MSQEDTSVFPRRNPAACHCLRGASQAFAVRTPLLLGGVVTCTQGKRDAHQQLELSLKYCFILTVHENVDSMSCLFQRKNSVLSYLQFKRLTFPQVCCIYPMASCIPGIPP